MKLSDSLLKINCEDFLSPLKPTSYMLFFSDLITNHVHTLGYKWLNFYCRAKPSLKRQL